MTRSPYAPLVAGCALLVIGATTATADCAAELAAYQSGSAEAEGGGEIAKDGSLAPMQTETAGDAAATTGTAGEADDEAAQEEGVAKDGTEAPMQEETADTSGESEAGAAISGQDAQAQQQADAPAGGDARAEALARAEAALAAGDEEGCMAALEEARSS